LNHADFIDLIPSYALDCLEPDEKRQVDQHLASCSECQVELRAYLETVSGLAMAVPQVKPPARLKRVILRRIQPAQVKPGLWEQLQGWWRGLSPAWGLAGVALVLVLIASNIVIGLQVQSLAASNVQLGQQVQILAHPTAAVSDFQMVALAGTAIQSDASGLMVISQDGGDGTLTVDGLKLLPVEKQYQLWLVKDGKRTSGGVFSVDEKGYAAIVVHAPLPLKSYTTFGITIEPAGGSPGPTGEKVMGNKT
jgi:anti-sigma-K factor RskA